MAIPLKFLELHLFRLLIIEQLLDAQLGALSLVEMLVNNLRLALPKPDEIDHIREDLDQPEMARLIQILEGEIVDAALAEQFAQNDEETHQIARVGREDAVGVPSGDVFSCGAHGGRNHLAGRVHEQFGEPFEDFLDNLRVRLLEVLDGEVDAYIGDAACDLVIRLRM
jgi:hypothetical protein